MKTSVPCSLPSAKMARMGAKKEAEKGRKVSGHERTSLRRKSRTFLDVTGL